MKYWLIVLLITLMPVSAKKEPFYVKHLELPSPPMMGTRYDVILEDWYETQVLWVIKLNEKIAEINEALQKLEEK